MAAEKRRFLDVWIIESNTVYREVPYTVVCDWIQQGQKLGLVGSTGLSVGSHLHLQLEVGGVPTDPLPLIGCQ